MGANRAIGKNGNLPWRCPDDMYFFKFMTWGKIIIMGRKTYDSFPNGPLDGRTSYVISKTPFDTPRLDDPNFRIYMPSVEAAIKDARMVSILYPDMDDCWIIGGASIYQQAIQIADEIYLNIMYDEYEGDTYFPSFEKQYDLVSTSNKQHFSANHYKRKIKCLNW